MKYIHHILAFTLLFMVVKAGIDNVSASVNLEVAYCCEHECSTDSDNSDTDPDHKDSDNAPCNPFQLHSCCVFIGIDNPYQNLKASEFVLKRFITLKPDFKSQYFEEIWQPPKIV